MPDSYTYTCVMCDRSVTPEVKLPQRAAITPDGWAVVTVAPSLERND